MDKLYFLHDLGMDILEDALPDLEEQLHSFLPTALGGENGQQKPGLFVTLNVFLPHGDEAKHVTVNLKWRRVFPHLNDPILTK